MPGLTLRNASCQRTRNYSDFQAGNTK